MKLTYTVTDDFNGNIKEFCQKQGFSTTQIKRFKYNGSICVNGQPCTVRKGLCAGDFVELCCNEELDPVLPGKDAATILFCDDYLFVADKPFGIPVHPDRKYKEGTFGNMLAAAFGEDFRLRIVTRLDKTTSGLVLGARNEICASALNDLQLRHEIHKTYYAKVQGELVGAGNINLPLGRLDEQNKTVVDAKGKEALTSYQALFFDGTSTIVMLRPHTGRTHQLRAHMAAIGHPICGDELYGGSAADRIYLHCAKLEFVHPFSRENICVESPCPF